MTSDGIIGIRSLAVCRDDGEVYIIEIPGEGFVVDAHRDSVRITQNQNRARAFHSRTDAIAFVARHAPRVVSWGASKEFQRSLDIRLGLLTHDELLPVRDFGSVP